MSMPRRRAIEERTCHASSCSPSISLDLRTSSVKDLQDGFGAELEAEPLHAADQSPLVMPYRGQRHGQRRVVPAKPGPVGPVMDVG